MQKSEKLILPAFLLSLFLGPLGIHRFYVGKTASGVVMLLLSLTIVGLIVTAIWNLVDFITIIVGGFRDGDGKVLNRWVQ